MTTVSVDLESKVPHYEQLRAQLAALINSGRLRDGQRLPTVRALANDLAIAPGTVARTYRDLEASGLVTTRRRVGTVVTAPPHARERNDVTSKAAELATLAADLGLTDAELHDVLAAALAAQRAPDASVPTARKHGDAPSPQRTSTVPFST